MISLLSIRTHSDIAALPFLMEGTNQCSGGGGGVTALCIQRFVLAKDATATAIITNCAMNNIASSIGRGRSVSSVISVSSERKPRRREKGKGVEGTLCDGYAVYSVHIKASKRIQTEKEEDEDEEDEVFGI